jgi:hydroxyacylglutathione hydrolase
MMKISPHVHLIGSEQFALSHPLDCNCYLIDGGSALGLIDTGLGLGVDDIMANLAAAGFRPDALTHIFITHAHIGHWGGAGELRARTGARIWAPDAGAAAMTEIGDDPGIKINLRFGRYPPGFCPRPCEPDRTFCDGERVVVGDIELSMIRTAGHTPDSTCIGFKDDGRIGLFTGDVLFYGGRLGLINLHGCRLEDYRRDIHKLDGLGVDMLLPGHGVFVLRRGQKHIERAIAKLGDFVMPDTFFEENEFTWSRECLQLMSGSDGRSDAEPRGDHQRLVDAKGRRH